ncbi:hypothetical protein C3469_21745 [Mycobacterium kansasii]|nr:hypothetical protein C3479_23115 [Mycobacterium kansasii]POY23746.1 hypothetical protein C3469_21745 [Mycobacterium kansasii]POY30703.1 hypothetical protein C3478_20460 [Mycobacterium kansasii]
MLFAAAIQHIGIPCRPVGQDTASLTRTGSTPTWLTIDNCCNHPEVGCAYLTGFEQITLPHIRFEECRW